MAETCEHLVDSGCMHHCLQYFYHSYLQIISFANNYNFESSIRISSLIFPPLVCTDHQYYKSVKMFDLIYVFSLFITLVLHHLYIVLLLKFISIVRTLMIISFHKWHFCSWRFANVGYLYFPQMHKIIFPVLHSI